MTHDIITWHSRPALDRIVFISGLPGVGNVGKIAADFMASELDAQPMLTLLSSELPPQVSVDQDCIGRMAKQELRYCRVGDQDVVFLLGDFQGVSSQGQYELSKSIFDIIVAYDPRLIITLGGYGIGAVVTDPRVFGVATRPELKPDMEKCGILFSSGEPAGGIIGAAAAFLGIADAYGVDGVSVIGETSGAILDYKSARAVVQAVAEILDTRFDLTDFEESVRMIDELNSEAQSLAPGHEDLSYIG